MLQTPTLDSGNEIAALTYTLYTVYWGRSNHRTIIKLRSYYLVIESQNISAILLLVRTVRVSSFSLGSITTWPSGTVGSGRFAILFVSSSFHCDTRSFKLKIYLVNLVNWFAISVYEPQNYSVIKYNQCIILTETKCLSNPNFQVVVICEPTRSFSNPTKNK